MEEHKSLAQSFELTIAGYDFSRSQKRLLYEIIKNVQPLYQGVNVNEQKKTPLDFADLLGKRYVIPIKRVIGDGNKNYVQLKESLYEMTKKLIRVSDTNRGFSIVSFFDSIDIPEGSGLIYVRMTLSFYESMANISRGLTVYDYEVARNFPSTYAMKMYEYIARWDTRPPREVPLETLRNVLGVNIVVNENGKTVIKRKYPNIKHFEGYILKVAKKQIDDPKYGSAYKFEYERILDAKTKHVSGYRITVHKDTALLTDRERRFEYSKEHNSVYLELPKAVIDKLKNMGWANDEIYPHIALLKACVKYIPDILRTLSELGCRSREEYIENPKGWMIGVLKKQLAEKGISITPDGDIVISTKRLETGDLFSQFCDAIGNK